MAYTLPGGATTQYMFQGSFAQTPPFTFAVWGKVSSLAAAKVSLSLGDQATGGDHWTLYVNTDGSVRAQTASGGGGSSAEAVTSTTTTTGVWFHMCGVFASATDRRAYLNGGGKGTNSTSITPGGTPQRLSWGAASNASASLKWSGDMMEAAVWSVALDDSEIAALGKAFSPCLIRPASLLCYFSGDRRDKDNTTVYDRWNGRKNFGYDASTGPDIADHGPMYYPTGLAV